MLLAIAALAWISGPLGSASKLTESLDANLNYEFVFASMPGAKLKVLHSRVERVTDRRFVWIIPLRSINGEWEFELVAARPWVEFLKRDYVPHDSGGVEKLREVPAWFSPNPEAFSAWYLEGTSGIHSAHLFVEREPQDDSRIRVFIRTH